MQMRSKEVAKVLLPRYLYHATFSALLDSILENGLGCTWRKNYKESKDGVVCLAEDPDVARDFALNAEDAPEEWKSDIIVLEVKTADLDSAKLEPDTTLQGCFEYNGVIKKFKLYDE